MRARAKLIAAVLVVALITLTYLATQELLHTGERTERNTEVLRQICESDNTQNAKQVGLWDFVIGLADKFPTPDQTPAEKERSRKLTLAFKAELARTFPQRDCRNPVMVTTIQPKGKP